MAFVVAEIGVNWDGDFDLAKEMMVKAKETGCNAVKFQAYEEEIVKDHPERIRLMKSTITKLNIDEINHLAKSVGIEWFCTPMYSDAVDLLEPYVHRFKITESDGRPLLENKKSKLFERVLKTDKEIFVSAEKTPRNSFFYERPNIKWLYCVPKYPANLEDFDFTNLGDFDGFSNHCTHFIAPLTAAILGAEIIEIHITSDKSKDFVDNNVSYDYSELKNLVELIRLSEKIRK